MNFAIDKRPFLPHVTLCRAPFTIPKWKEEFTPLPMIIKNLHLYESKGELNYEPIWSYPELRPPFLEIEHAADRAFHIHGESVQQIYRHAFVALSFSYPPLLEFFDELIHNTENDETRKKVYPQAKKYGLSFMESYLNCLNPNALEGDVKRNYSSLMHTMMQVAHSALRTGREVIILPSTFHPFRSKYRKVEALLNELKALTSHK